MAKETITHALIKIIIIDDDNKYQAIITQQFSLIGKSSYELTYASDYDAGVSLLFESNYDVCMVHHHLHHDFCLDFLQKIHSKGSHAPVIVLIPDQCLSSPDTFMAAGASDYMYENELNPQWLQRIIRYALERKKNDNQLLEINKQLQYLATNDVLTGIANRNQFNNKLPLLLEHSIRNQQTIAIMFLDLDQFKQVNDTFGHSYGDLLLQQVTERLKDNMRKVDNIFRLGGDEFIIVIDGVINKQKVAQLALKIIKILSIPFILNEHTCQISTSIGITMASFDDMRTPEQLVKEADIAMYSAKKNGRNTFQFYHPDFFEEFLKNSHLSVDLQQAQTKGELIVYFQPLVSFVSNQIIGVEALLRWHHPALGHIPPTVFIPVAEKTGLILSIGEWVFRQACLQKKIWQDMGYTDLLMAVNVSIFQLQQSDFIEIVNGIIDDTGVDPKCMEIEISESVITTNFDDCANKMARLKAKGMRLVIDDFGTGYSNLGYLKHFCFDKIKIDKIFIDEIISSHNEQYIVEAIISMAKKMGLEIVAEGVETIEQADYLRSHHSDQVQGFYFSEPLSADECTEFLKKGVDLSHRLL